MRGKHYISALTKQELGDCMLFNLLYKDISLNKIQVRRILTNTYNRLGGYRGNKIFEKIKHLADIAKRKEAEPLHGTEDSARRVHIRK